MYARCPMRSKQFAGLKISGVNLFLFRWHGSTMTGRSRHDALCKGVIHRPVQTTDPEPALPNNSPSFCRGTTAAESIVALP